MAEIKNHKEYLTEEECIRFDKLIIKLKALHDLLAEFYDDGFKESGLKLRDSIDELVSVVEKTVKSLSDELVTQTKSLSESSAPGIDATVFSLEGDLLNESNSVDFYKGRLKDIFKARQPLKPLLDSIVENSEILGEQAEKTKMFAYAVMESLRQTALGMDNKVNELSRIIENAELYKGMLSDLRKRAEDRHERALSLFTDTKLRAKFSKLFSSKFDRDEFEDLCFDLGIPFEELETTAPSRIARKLISYMHRNSKEWDLVKELQKRRPSVDWLWSVE